MSDKFKKCELVETQKKPNLFEWTLSNIRIEKIISTPV